MDRSNTIRTSVDIPLALHRKLHRTASEQGCSARLLILRGIENVVGQTQPQPKKRVSFPLIRSKNPKQLRVTSDMIYDVIELP